MQHEEISWRAYAKWLTRSQEWDRRLQDWLDAETELAFEAGMKGKLTEAKERLVSVLAERQEAERQLVAEHAVSSILALASSLSDAAPQLVQAICECLDWDVGAVWILEQDVKLLRCVAIWYNSYVDVPAFEQETILRTYSSGIGLPGRVWANESLVWIPDVTSDANFPRGAIAAKEGLRGAIGFPVHNGIKFLGVLEFFSREVQQPDNTLLAMMTSIAYQISQFIERRGAESRLLAEERDRLIAREIQLSLLPKTMPYLPGFQISGKSATANLVGGDWFDYIPLSVEGRDCLCVALADASGHGIGSALLAVQTRAYLRSLVLTCSDVGLLLEFANLRLSIDMASDHFVTAFFMRLDSGSHSLNYASAGHLPGYILDSRGQIRAVLPSTDLPLGIDLATKFPASTVSFEPGDMVLLTTDGITEAASPDGDLFGMERTLHLVREHRRERPDDIITALFDGVSHFCDNKCLDDLTALIIKVEGAD